MNLTSPPFWYRKNDEQAETLEKILTPVSALYRFAYAVHQMTGRREKFPLPVLCVGNINVGGAGKTPSSIALMQIIKARSLARNPFFLSRGYGGAEIGPLLIDPAKHSAWDTGDESLLLAAAAPGIIAHDRAKGIALAMREGADMIVMDDGLQNPGVKKDIRIVVIDGEAGFGNGKTLPAGPLREPLKSGLSKADAFILIGADSRDVSSLLPAGKPVFTASFKPEDEKIPKNRKYIAFAGIGRPEKFFATLRACNINPVETIEFADHYPYGEKDIEDLLSKAQAKDASLITTEKDFQRIPEGKKPRVHMMRAPLKFTDENAVAEFLKSRIIFHA